MCSDTYPTGRSTLGHQSDPEEPAFTVIDRVEQIEIRRYDLRLAAETVVFDTDAESARRTGFRLLADYIFGNNNTRAKIEMTAPVAQSSQRIAMTAPAGQQQTAKGSRLRFFLPQGFTQATAPLPKNENVTLVTVPACNYAVLRFSGSRDDTTVAAHTATLKATVENAEWRATAEPVAWFYDPPWTPPSMRRNEVAIEVCRLT